jgi:hypothetical protein
LMSNYVEHYRVLLRKKLQLLLGSIQHPEWRYQVCLGRTVSPVACEAILPLLKSRLFRALTTLYSASSHSQRCRPVRIYKQMYIVALLTSRPYVSNRVGLSSIVASRSDHRVVEKK